MKAEKQKIYILYDWIDDEVIMVSFDKNSIFAKVGQDAMTGVDINDYCLKSAFISDLNDECL
ncbi:hypothetical protein [Ezakiella peruensis]|uniref:hypothetical protein n=1 Tax=Ezakiella peruensis TaxID=1464038 RepID=UPI000C1B001C|nr:hypothetical protein [Ezakiella peruensis]